MSGRIVREKDEGTIKVAGILLKSAVVKKEGDKWKLYTKDGTRVLGTHDTAAQAYAQEYAIQKSEERRRAKEAAGGMSKAAKEMVRRTKVIKKVADYCPHCDHEFGEKDYPRPRLPDDEEARAEALRTGDYDEFCPHCDGLVDTPELTDAEIDAMTEEWGGAEMAEIMRQQREVRRKRIAAREVEKSASCGPCPREQYLSKIAKEPGPEKAASPRWVKVLSSLSPASRQRLAAALPAGKTRQLTGTADRGYLGEGSEAVIRHGFTGGGVGRSVLKNFFEAQKGNRSAGAPGWIKEQVEGMRAFPDIMGRVNHPTRVGYSMEPLLRRPPAGTSGEAAMKKLLDAVRPHMPSGTRKVLRDAEAATGAVQYTRPANTILTRRGDSHAWAVDDAFSNNSNLMYRPDGRLVVSDPQMRKVPRLGAGRLERIRHGRDKAAGITNAGAGKEVPGEKGSPGMIAAVRKARRETDVHATEKMREAGNYKKGRVSFHGIPIAIENPKNSVRSGKTSSGKAWSSLLTADYGYFTGSEAIDGDDIDVFIGPSLDSELVVVVDQHFGGKFDESKFIVGVDSRKEGEDLYLSNYQKGWKLGPVSTCSVDQLKAWLKDGDHKKPFKGQLLKAARLGRIAA